MKYILHIDTSAEPGMAALSSEGRVLAQRQIAESRQQASLLNVLIEELFTELSLKAKDLSAVAVCAGPGSYTGLRIGMAAAKAFCYVWDLPLLAHNKLTLLAVQMAKFAPQFSAYLPCLNARENEFFAALYDGDMNELYAPEHLFTERLEELIAQKENILLIGNVNPQNEVFSSKKDLHIAEVDMLDLNAWALYAFNELNCNRTVNLAMAEPFYLKQVYTHNSKKDS